MKIAYSTDYIDSNVYKEMLKASLMLITDCRNENVSIGILVCREL